jgi:alanyl-tRNA synthetase
MLTKDSVKKIFQQHPEKYWQVELFKEKGYVRKQCTSCGKFFWTLDQDRKTCADASCEDYGFIGKPITKGKWDYIETWKMFEKYFKSKGHASVPRYPVVDRWRPDLYFTIASIQDFQRIEGRDMKFEYPANPLVVPQMCLRFQDMTNVGITGRHLTGFCMSGQHAFNYPKEGYFKDQCIDYNFEFLSKKMGIPEQELVYAEDIWAMPDFSGFGPCLETFSQGLELVNSVFTEFQADPRRDLGFRPLDMQVIDVGWGHERLVWFSNATPSSYECLFGPVTKMLTKKAGVAVDPMIFGKYSAKAGKLDADDLANVEEEKAKIANSIGITLKQLKEEIEPLQGVYAILDHTRTLLFATADGGIPSNVGGGYNLRMVLRRALNFINKYNLDFDLLKVAEEHAKFLKPMYPELMDGIEPMKKIIDSEKKKYANTMQSARKTISRLVEKKTKFTNDNLSKLYESQGITPEMIKEVDPDAKIPENFYSKLTEKHQSKHTTDTSEKKSKDEYDLSKVPETKKNFYGDFKDIDFTAKVQKIFKVRDNIYDVVLDETNFYATSGGQPADKGTIAGYGVLDVRKYHNHIIHKIKVDDKLSFKENDLVDCLVDIDRRTLHAQHHTSAHVVNAAANFVLGKHVWQAGSGISTEKGRLDISHYDSVTKDEQEKIEKKANEYIKLGAKVDKFFMPRSKAEEKYGFRLYQGGAPAGNNLRVVDIPGVDVEACGGTHVNNTKDIEVIKILKTSKIQDGIVRIEYSAGSAASAEAKKAESTLSDIAKFLKVKESQIPGVAQELFNNWKKAKKAVKKKKKFPLSDLELKSKEEFSGDILQKTADLLKTQKEHVFKTIQRFYKELEENKKKIKELPNE